jgi:hypothetical protein
MEKEKVVYYENREFIGTWQYHRPSFTGRLLATDGALHVFETLKCYWLSDMIASYIPTLDRIDDGFFVVRFHLKGDGGMFTIDDGNGHTHLRQKVPFTDLTENIKLYLTKEADGRYICMLPSEY